MKYFFVFLLFVCLTLSSQDSFAAKRREKGLPRTEVGLMNNVLGCLVHKDTFSYYNLFPPFDTLWSMVMHNPDRSPETNKALEDLKEHPQALLRFDPFYNHQIMGRFVKVLEKGEDSGIHWSSVVMQRYELQKETMTRDLAGYDKISPERFKGYMFIRDLMGRLTFCVTITEIQKINGYFFGGQVINILEAASIDQYIIKEQEERKYYEWMELHKNDEITANAPTGTDTNTSDTNKNKNLSIANTTEDEKHVRREVIDRKYYQGKFDDEIPVKLFIRYLRDVKAGSGKQFFDGLYKFGDQVQWAKLNITKDAEGKWVMEDDPPVGTLELEMVGKNYTGSWTNNENQTGYDVLLKPADILPKKLEQLDYMLETGSYGRADAEVTDKVDGEDKSPKMERLEKKLKRQRDKEKQREKDKEEEDSLKQAQDKADPPKAKKKPRHNDDE